MGLSTLFVHAVSTAHSIHGTTRTLRPHGTPIHVTAVEPAESAVLSGGVSGLRYLSTDLYRHT